MWKVTKTTKNLTFSLLTLNLKLVFFSDRFCTSWIRTSVQRMRIHIPATIITTYFKFFIRLRVSSVVNRWRPDWRPVRDGPAGTAASYSSSEPEVKTTGDHQIYGIRSSFLLVEWSKDDSWPSNLWNINTYGATKD